MAFQIDELPQWLLPSLNGTNLISEKVEIAAIAFGICICIRSNEMLFHLRSQTFKTNTTVRVFAYGRLKVLWKCTLNIVPKRIHRILKKRQKWLTIPI